MIHTQIEIAASPEAVRRVLLDFENIPSWHTGHVKSIHSVAAGKPTVEKGDKLSCEMAGLKFQPIVLENSPSCLSWQGPPVYGLVAGLHSFLYQPSETTPGHTTFVQQESFSGMASFVMNPSLPPGKKLKAQFEEFNRDLKKKVEEA